MTTEFHTLLTMLVAALVVAGVVVFLVGLIARACRRDHFDEQSQSGYFYTFMLLLVAGLTVVVVAGL